MGLTRAGLSIGQHTSVVPFQHSVEGRNQSVEYIFLRRVGIKNSVEGALNCLVRSFIVANGEACTALINVNHLDPESEFRRNSKEACTDGS